MTMRFAWYAGTSTVLAAGVIATAFHQRANFYSAMVHLAQSNLSLMIIINLCFLLYGSFMYGLQRLCYGQLRPVEIEQLYEKAWFAVTETCLAMTIFREEVGAFFLVMFTALVTGKVWGWIGEGRVEVLEQQPPANPGLFHTRLSVSLLLSVVYDIWLLHFATKTVIQQARPNMMVMFLFEFAVLAVCSLQTAIRYVISLVEANVLKRQTKLRLEERKRQAREARDEAVRAREARIAAGEEGAEDEPIPEEEEVDEMDIEVPGWESKGQWVLSLDLVADFIKLGLYAAFFCVLLTFYGLPIHIMRDLFMTTRSFVKRLTALMRYRQAVRDMNKYPDATEEELSREDTCIICREEMRPWNQENPGQVERYRPKRLPCGHILHFGCLKSWLERQQVCPTCRSSVVIENRPQPRNNEAIMVRLGLNFPGAQNPPPAANAAPPPGGAAPVPGAQNVQQPAQNNNNNNNNMRMINLGPLRLGFAQGGAQDIQQMAQQLAVAAEGENPAATTPAPIQQQQTDPLAAVSSLETIRNQLQDLSARVQQEVAGLNTSSQEVHALFRLVVELERIRQQQVAQQQIQQQELAPGAGANAHTPMMAPGPLPQFPAPFAPFPQAGLPGPVPFFPQPPPGFQPFQQRLAQPSLTRHGAPSYGAAIPSGSSELPEGVTIPPGWSLLPLERLDGSAQQPAQSPFPTPSQDAQRHVDQNNDLEGLSTESSMAHPDNHTELSGASMSGADVTAGPSSGPNQAPPVTAPTPVPNWGGLAQLFNGNRGGTLSNQPSQDASSAASSGVPPQHSEETAVSSATQGERPADAAPQNGHAAADKGKAKAATVEDAEEAEEDDEDEDEDEEDDEEDED